MFFVCQVCGAAHNDYALTRDFTCGCILFITGVTPLWWFEITIYLRDLVFFEWVKSYSSHIICHRCVTNLAYKNDMLRTSRKTYVISSNHWIFSISFLQLSIGLLIIIYIRFMYNFSKFDRWIMYANLLLFFRRFHCHFLHMNLVLICVLNKTSRIHPGVFTVHVHGIKCHWLFKGRFTIRPWWIFSKRPCQTIIIQFLHCLTMIKWNIRWDLDLKQYLSSL